MADKTDINPFDDPVLPQSDGALADLDLFNQDPLFQAIDPSLTLTATPSLADDFHADFLYPGTQSLPGSPLPHHYSSSDPCSPYLHGQNDHSITEIPSPEPYFPRAHSQPPEEVTFHRSGHFLGRPTGSRHPYPPAQKGSSRSAAAKGWRQPPYTRPNHTPAQRQTHRGVGPTSVPISTPSLVMTPVPAMMQPAEPVTMQTAPQPILPMAQNMATMLPQTVNDMGEPDEADRCRFQTRQDQTTLVMGLLSYVDRLSKECENMKGFIRRGFSEIQDGRGEELERLRLEKRNANSMVTELDEPLQQLPWHTDESKAVEGQDLAKVPQTGQEIRDLDDEAAAALLVSYDIHTRPSMFLFEKKVLYLTFIGASRKLMHRVLD